MSLLGVRVAVTTAPGGGSLIGAAVGAWRSRAKPVSRSKALAAFAAKAREHVLDIAALAAAVEGGFTVFHHGGWFVLFGALGALNFVLTGK